MGLPFIYRSSTSVNFTSVTENFRTTLATEFIHSG